MESTDFLALTAELAVAIAGFSGVIVALETLVALQPDVVAFQLDLGDLYLHRERPEEAEDRFRNAIRLAPDSADAHYRLGLVLEAASRIDEAETAYRRAQELDPTSPAAGKLQSPIGN